jgi:hypothetical protein
MLWCGVGQCGGRRRLHGAAEGPTAHPPRIHREAGGVAAAVHAEARCRSRHQVLRCTQAAGATYGVSSLTVAWGVSSWRAGSGPRCRKWQRRAPVRSCTATSFPRRSCWRG